MFTFLSHRRIGYIHATALQKLLWIDGRYWNIESTGMGVVR